MTVKRICYLVYKLFYHNEMKLRILFILLLFYSCSYSQQEWSPWKTLKDDKQNLLEYKYRLNPQSTKDKDYGNSFAIRIRSKYISPVCGSFSVTLTMISGKEKSISETFNSLKPNVEMMCPGIYQFADVRSFVSAGNVIFKDCGNNSTGSKTSPASFTIDFHNEASKGGMFKYIDPKGQFSFETKTSSGHLAAANDPHTQQFKNMGLIPNGTWYISSIKDKGKMILRLTPSANVVNPNNRDGFLIHGYNTNPEDASVGCIILEQVYREKLMKAFLRDGKIELRIENKVY